MFHLIYLLTVKISLPLVAMHHSGASPFFHKATSMPHLLSQLLAGDLVEWPVPLVLHIFPYIAVTLTCNSVDSILPNYLCAMTVE